VGDELAGFIPAKRAHVGDQPGVADDHLYLAADLARHGDRGIRVGLKPAQRGAVHANLRSRARDFHHLANRIELRRRGFCRRWCCLFLAEAADFIEKFAQVRLLVH
jgi:hypothetical protein